VAVDGEEFDAWVCRAAPRLHRTAYLLTGDWALAQDLVQHACAVTWPRFASLQEPEGYARTVMARTASSGWRRRWRGEVPHGELPEQAAADSWGDVDRRHVLAAALRALPAKQRAVLVLRFYDDLSEADTARALSWPLGTVKSTTSRALASLRGAGLNDLEVRR
jgi:RNA polymerase sigma-70 factor (sigma-E family)